MAGDGPEAEAHGYPISEQTIGLLLAISSSLFIGLSFIVKKKGLKLAGATGVRAGSGGYGYLVQPMWWAGLLSMVVGEMANFAAYAYAPAMIVTPLGALSIIVSAVLAHFILKEKLHPLGVLGCILCITGSVSIVLHAPEERTVSSVLELWLLALEPGFLLYASLAIFSALILAVHTAPLCGNTNVLVYVGICSLAGSLSVMSVKALGIALKLTLAGSNQFLFAETYYCLLVVVFCVATQMNYLNKALDIFNTAIVSPIYYVLFTTLTLAASTIMMKEWQRQTPSKMLTQACGMVTIISGIYLLHATKDYQGLELGQGVAGIALPVVAPLNGGVTLPKPPWSPW